MRILITLFIALVSLGLFSSTALAQKNLHLGKWQGTVDDEIGAMQFNEDGSLRVFQNGKELSEMDDDTIVVRYEIDYSHKPIRLDVIIALPDGAEILRGLAIVRFEGEEMVMKVGDKPEQRPAAFGEEKKTETLRFRKVAEFDFDGVE